MIDTRHHLIDYYCSTGKVNLSTMKPLAKPCDELRLITDIFNDCSKVARDNAQAFTLPVTGIMIVTVMMVAFAHIVYILC